MARLSPDRIVDAAVALLDEAGEAGLTTRSPAAHLGTGPGAIHHHVDTEDALLGAATDAVVAHPWLSGQIAAQIARRPGTAVAPRRLFEHLGREVRALGTPEDAWFTAASALMHYVLGAAGPNAVAATYGRTPATTRAGFLDGAAQAWEQLDPGDSPFTRAVAGRLRDHDDREELLAGLDLVLDGIAARSPG